MNLRISDPKIEELAQQLANRTGETLQEAVTRALEERLNRQPAAIAQIQPDERADREARKAAIMEIVERVKKMPVLDDRTPDEIIGYNEHGHFD